MRKSSILCVIMLMVIAGAGCNEKTNKDDTSTAASIETSETSAKVAYDPKRGEGKFHDVKLDPTLNGSLALKGEKVSDLKCISCHKLTDEKLVGPGWKGVTTRHKPEWIMNFITNTDEMIDKDPKAQAMLELCMVRMPNQNLSDEDARALLEFMRKNDGLK